MTAFFSSLRSATPLLTSPLLVLALLLLLSGCTESDSGTAPPPFNPDTDYGDTDADGDTTPKPCDLPTGGECQGPNLHYCDGGVEKVVECAEVYEDGLCGKSGLQAQCQVRIGRECVVDDNGTTRYPRCLGIEAGCVAEDLASPHMCVENIGTCNSGDVGKCMPGNRYAVRGCLNGQPRVYDCTAMGGRCAGDGCLELPLGADCETTVKTSIKYLRCDPRFTCYNSSPIEEFGTCVTMQDLGETCETEAQTATKRYICKSGLVCYSPSEIEQFGTCVAE